MELTRLAVVLPTHRQPESLILTLRDLSAQDYPVDAWELVVIDDGSQDHSAVVAMTSLSRRVRITVQRLPRGGMYCHARLFNELIRLADPACEVLVHVEDVRIRPDFLRQHEKWHRTDSLYLVTGPMCESQSETFGPESCGRWPLMQMSGVASQAYRCCFQAIFAKCMSYSRALLERLKNPQDPEPFDASMSGWGCHETEFAYRAEKAGATCIYDTGCAVYHLPHTARDELEYRHIDRHRVQAQGRDSNIPYFCEKHGLTRLPNWRVGEPLSSPQLVVKED